METHGLAINTRDLAVVDTLAPAATFIPVQAVVPTLALVAECTQGPEGGCTQDQVAGFIPVLEAECIPGRAEDFTLDQVVDFTPVREVVSTRGRVEGCTPALQMNRTTAISRRGKCSSASLGNEV